MALWGVRHGLAGSLSWLCKNSVMALQENCHWERMGVEGFSETKQRIRSKLIKVGREKKKNIDTFFWYLRSPRLWKSNGGRLHGKPEVGQYRPCTLGIPIWIRPCSLWRQIQIRLCILGRPIQNFCSQFYSQLPISLLSLLPTKFNSQHNNQFVSPWWMQYNLSSNSKLSLCFVQFSFLQQSS